jgi:hypothetical protein
LISLSGEARSDAGGTGPKHTGSSGRIDKKKKLAIATGERFSGAEFPSTKCIV